MLIAIDIDGTLSAFPLELGQLMTAAKAAGHTVHVVSGTETTATETDAQEKASLLESIGCGSCYDALVVVPPPHAENKLSYLQSVDCDLLIDNSKDNAKACAGLCLVLVPWQTREASDDPVAKELDALASVIVKSVPERQFTLGLAYPAMKADAIKAVDGRRDFIGPDALELTAWQYVAKSREVGLVQHFSPELNGHGTVVESYIYRGPDWVQADIEGHEQIIKAGDWLVGIVWDDPAWQAIKLGLVRGLSPEGAGKRSVPTPDRLAQLRS